MKSRCRPYDKRRKHYYDKGITVCERWEKSFIFFIQDMGMRPPNMTLDRIDNDKGYYKDNCRWATAIEQANNTSRTVRHDYKGNRVTIREVSKLTGIEYSSLCYRVRSGMSMEEAVNYKPKKKKKKKVKIERCPKRRFSFGGRMLTVKQWALIKKKTEAHIWCRLEKGYHIGQIVGDMPID